MRSWFKVSTDQADQIWFASPSAGSEFGGGTVWVKMPNKDGLVNALNFFASRTLQFYSFDSDGNPVLEADQVSGLNFVFDSGIVVPYGEKPSRD